MQLKTLQIQGFKSFPDKTVLHFDKGITAVVGPNGSGKSNISDAMGWVMGEQSARSLRGEKMEDVIFLGTDKRKATGYAYVSLTFDNRDRTLAMESDEVTISRRLYRSGESEYRINHTAVRLKDICELLMDTGLGRDGYSIIGQGRIDEIVSAKSSQRREIFEEAAGISKYRCRKEEAEKKLESAHENLLRLKDIMSELESRVEPLRIQSEKAKKFLTLAEEKKKLEISLWMDSAEQLSHQMEEQRSQGIMAKNKAQDAEAVLEDYTRQVEEHYTELQKSTVEIENSRKRTGELAEQIAQLDSAAAVLENDILHNSNSIQEIETTISRASSTQSVLIETIRKNQEDLAEGKKKLLEAAQEKEELQQNQAEVSLLAKQSGERISLLKSRRNAYEQSITVEKLNQASSAALLEETKARLDSMEQVRQTREENLAGLRKEQQDCRDLLEAISQKEEELKNSIHGCELKKASRVRQMEEYRNKQLSLRQEADKLSHQAGVLEDMERSMEGFQNSVRQVVTMGRTGRLRGIHGPVSQLISTESQYSLAIETALGGSMQSIVVEDEESAKDAILYLKTHKSGRATFLPLTTIKSQSLNQKGLAEEDGFLGIAAELVHTKAEYRSIIENLLGKIVIAENINDAVSIARKYGYRFRIVTLDGQIVNAGGSLTGGSTVKNAGLLSRRAKIEELTLEAEKLNQKSGQMDQEIKELQKEIDSVNTALFSLEAQMKSANEDRITCNAKEKQLAVSIADMADSQKNEQLAEEKARERLDEIRKASQSSDEIIAKARTELEEIAQSLEENKRLQEERQQELQTIQEQINEKRFLLLSLTKDQESLTETSRRMNESKNQQQDELSQQTERVRQLKIENKTAQEEILSKTREKERLQTESKETAVRMEQLFQEQNRLEQVLTQMREKEKEHIASRERANSECQRLEDKYLGLQTEYDKFIARLWDEYNLTRSQAMEISEPIKDSMRAKARLADLKNQIKNLGSINVEAIDEYEEVFRRYQFMKVQMEDVEHSRNELLTMIRELTAQMQEQFITSFNAIREHFSRIFAELFGGGRGELLLTAPDDILTSGIDIRVQPPGKIIKSLSALSGGEKALVAIAIYFAILKVKPSPFCILDEIEAALDEVNVGRYARYLRKLADNTQFISITHRRGTMEEADVMYGVTMQEKGVSRLLELDITKVESELGIQQEQ